MCLGLTALCRLGLHFCLGSVPVPSPRFLRHEGGGAITLSESCTLTSHWTGWKDFYTSLATRLVGFYPWSPQVVL